MTIATFVINGHTYNDAMWRADWEGTLSSLVSDIITVQGSIAGAGKMTKAISGNVTLSGPESQNFVFVITGALSATAKVTFAAGFSGIAVIINQTTGGFDLTAGLAAGTTVTIPTGGAAAAVCDGTNFSLQTGVAKTATGAKVVGALLVTTTLAAGNTAITGTLGATGNATFGGTLNLTGAATLGDTLHLVSNAIFDATLSVGTNAVIGGTLGVDGDTDIGGHLGVNGDTILVGPTLIAAALTVNAAITSTNASTENRMYLSAPAGHSTWYEYRTGSVARWLEGKDDVAEAGSNAGSNWALVRCSDAGAVLGEPIQVNRATGRITFGELPTSASGLSAGQLWNNAGVLSVA